MDTLEHDALTTFLHGQGERTEVEYFGHSEFVIGRRLRQREFEMVYRQEGHDVVIADFVATQPHDDAGAVSGFIRLIHCIERGMPPLQRVRGLFVRSQTQPQLNHIRERLARVLERQGAHWQVIDGDPWLVYPLHGGRNQGH